MYQYQIDQRVNFIREERETDLWSIGQQGEGTDTKKIKELVKWKN